jgi:hypothetical protein
MSTHAQSVSTTLKRRRAQADEQINNDSDRMNYPAAGLRRLLESGDSWEDSEYLHSMVSSDSFHILPADGNSNRALAQ